MAICSWPREPKSPNRFSSYGGIAVTFSRSMVHLRAGRRSAVRIALWACITASAGCGGDSSGGDIRMINVSQGYNALDLYLNSTKVLSNIGYGTMSKYARASPDTYTVGIAVSGVSSDLLTKSLDISKNQSYTFVAYGSTGQFATLEYPEEESNASDGHSKVQLINAVTAAGAVDVYITNSSVTLEDVSPTFSGAAVSSIASEGYVSITSGTYRLRVTATGSKTDLRLDVASVTFSGTEVATIILSDTTGGVLVNAGILPQQGSLITENNADARLRAVVGLSSGADVDVAVGSTSLLSAASTHAIGSYTLVAAGTDAVSLTVGGGAVTVADQDIAAGSDNTLLIWNDSAGTQVSLLVDEDTPPPANYAKVKLINAMSGLGDPISLSLNYTQIANGVPLGSGSAFSQVSASSDAQIDVTNGTTSANLYTQTDVTLSSQGIYTVFMFGSSASPLGTLTQDR